jgi:hypothetical protein
MTSLGIGIVVRAIAKDVKQSAELNPRMIRWYVVVTPLIDRSTMEMIIIEDRKDMDPVTIAMIIPAFVKKNESISLAISFDMILVFVMFSDMMQLADADEYLRIRTGKWTSEAADVRRR